MSDTRAIVAVCRSCVNGHHSSRTPCRLTAPGGIRCECTTCPGVPVVALTPMAQALRYEFDAGQRRALRADLVDALRGYSATDITVWRRLVILLDEAAAADVAPDAAELVADMLDGEAANRKTAIRLAYAEHVHPHLKHAGTFATCTEGPCTYYAPADRERFAIGVDPDETADREATA